VFQILAFRRAGIGQWRLGTGAFGARARSTGAHHARHGDIAGDRGAPME